MRDANRITRTLRLLFSSSPLLLLSLALPVGEVSAQRALVRSGVPRAGATPGTEEWVAILRGRSFSPRARFAAIRAEPDRARRRTMIDALAADSRREQQAFRADVEFLGGRVLRHHWLFHACTIEIPRIRHGAAAAIGLLEGTAASRNVQLDLYGFPRVSADVLFQIRQATPNSFAVIGLGVANPNAPVGACRFLSSAELLITGGLATSAMGDARWAFTFPGGLLHQHIFAQAVTASGLYSNGLRLTIGGIAP